MRKNQIHALRGLLQTIMGYADLGVPTEYSDKIKQAVRDADKIIGQHKVQWPANKHRFELGKDLGLTLDSMPDALFIEIENPISRTAIGVPKQVARDMAELILAYCDTLDVRGDHPEHDRRDMNGGAPRPDKEGKD